MTKSETEKRIKKLLREYVKKRCPHEYRIKFKNYEHYDIIECVFCKKNCKVKCLCGNKAVYFSREMDGEICEKCYRNE